jgi:hypothetical protein
MRTIRTVTLGGLAAAVAATTMWMAPAWGQAQSPASDGRFPPVAAGPAMPAPASSTAEASMAMTASADLPRQLAAARLATAKYATSLARAKAHGYQIITPMMPNMGIHFMNPHITGFNIRKPQILVYEHHGSTWQLGALEWVFPAIPATPPLPDATFGSFPAACHYADGSFLPHKNATTCPKTNPATGSRFTFWHPDLVTMHVWAWYPNPAGLYSSTNPSIAPFNRG